MHGSLSSALASAGVKEDQARTWGAPVILINTNFFTGSYFVFASALAEVGSLCSDPQPRKPYPPFLLYLAPL